MFFFPCLNVIEYLRYSCDWSCYVNNNRYWTLGDWLLSWLTGCGYSSLCTPGHMVGWALPKLPKSRVCWSQDLSYHYGCHAALALAENCMTSERNPVNLSIYLPIYIWARKQVSIQSTDSKEGGGGWDNQDVHAKFEKILLTIYLYIYQYRYKISCIIQISFFKIRYVTLRFRNEV